MKKQVLLHFCVSLLSISTYVVPLTASPTAKVVNGTSQERPESLHGVLQKTELDPPLGNAVAHIRFSPDGKYVLAQDLNSIHILRREPFVSIFDIEAADVSFAQFTPDSQQVAFYDSKLRVQVWNVATKLLTSSQVVILKSHCQQTELSPDAKTFACLDESGDLVLADVGTGAQIFRKAGFYSPEIAAPFASLNPDVTLTMNFNDIRGKVINMDFSADGRYFAAGGRSAKWHELLDKSSTVTAADKSGFPNEYNADPNNINNTSDRYDARGPSGSLSKDLKVAAFDFTTRKQIELGGSLKGLLAGRFVFIGSDRIIGSPDTGKSELVAFPDGRNITSLAFNKADFAAPGHGDYVLVRPLGKYPVGIVDLKSGSVLMANKKSAIDLYDNVYVSERADGELGLYEVGKNELHAKVQLPRGDLAILQAVAVSPDFKWLAVSGSSSGAVWDLTKGERVFYVRGFEGAYYSEDGAFYVDFPKHEMVERTIGILQTQQREVLKGQQIEEQERVRSEQYGQFFTIMRRLYTKSNLNINGKAKVPISSVGRGDAQVNKNASLEVRDVRTMKQLWLKNFAKETPTLWVDAPNETMVLGWVVSDDVAKAEIKSDSRLTKQRRAMKESDFVYLFQIENASTGQQHGSILFSTEQNSLYVGYVIATNDSVVVVTSGNRIFVYSLVSGEKRGQFSGGYATVNKEANLLCIVNKNMQMTIYDLVTLKERDQFTFSSRVALARFSNDGKRLFVLTQSQTAYVLDVSSSVASQKKTGVHKPSALQNS